MFLAYVTMVSGVEDEIYTTLSGKLYKPVHLFQLYEFLSLRWYGREMGDAITNPVSPSEIW